MRVADVMSAPVHTVQAEEPAGTAWELMRLYDTRHLVVVTPSGEVAGIISMGDLGGRHGRSVRDGRRVADLMSDRVVTVTPATTVRDAANLMRGRRLGSLPVVEGTRLVGIITALDLLELIGRGAERPHAAAERWTLRNRGVRPPAQARAKGTGRSRERVG